MKEINYVDLGLKSGIKWSDCYISDTIRFVDIIKMSDEQYKCFYESLPTLDDFKELKDSCKIKVYKKGYYGFLLLIGPNGNKVRLMRYKIYTVYGHPFRYWLKDGFIKDNKYRVQKTFLLNMLLSKEDISYSITESTGNLIFVQR